MITLALIFTIAVQAVLLSVFNKQRTHYLHEYAKLRDEFNQYKKDVK